MPKSLAIRDGLTGFPKCGFIKACKYQQERYRDKEDISIPATFKAIL
jgi:hypothetical protein